MREFFDVWPGLKEKHGQAKLLVFSDGESVVLVQDDAVNAATLLDEDAEVTFGPDGAFWKIQAAYKAMYFRRLEAMGERIVYVGRGEAAPTSGGVKASKVRLPDNVRVAVGPRQIDQPTGRVYVGKATMGTFWWCPKDRQVFMRRHGPVGEWLGFYCHPSEWGDARHRLTERLAIPA